MSGQNNHMFGKSISDDTIAKISEAKAGKNNLMFGRIGENNPTSKKIYAYDKDNITTLSYEFTNYTKAAKFLIVIEKLFIILLIKINITKINGFYPLLS
jgi:hypothetical protein